MQVFECQGINSKKRSELETLKSWWAAHDVFLYNQNKLACFALERLICVLTWIGSLAEAKLEHFVTAWR